MQRHSFTQLAFVIALTLSFVGCDGGNKAKLADAPIASDANSGADAATGAHGLATIVVYDQLGQLAIGAPVVFIDSQQTQTTTTDGNGSASADVVAGASVSVVLPPISTNAPTLVQTIDGVQPQDQITLGAPALTGASDGQFTINFTPTTSAGSYSAFTSCGVVVGSASPIVFPMDSSCATSSTDVIVTAVDGETNLGFLAKTAVPFTPGASVTLAGAFTAEPTFTASYTDAANETQLALSRAVPNEWGDSNGGVATPTGGQAMIARPVTTGTTALVSTLATRGGATQSIFEDVDGTSLTYSLDVESRLLPWLGEPTFDVATSTIEIPVTADNTSGDAPDLFVAEVSYTRAAQGSGSAQSFDWIVYGPTPGNVILPALPAAAGDVNPIAGDVAGDAAALSVEEASVTGYGQARLTPWTLAFLVQTNLLPAQLATANGLATSPMRVASTSHPIVSGI
jgi:hypothetical protein